MKCRNNSIPAHVLSIFTCYTYWPPQPASSLPPLVQDITEQGFQTSPSNGQETDQANKVAIISYLLCLTCFSCKRHSKGLQHDELGAAAYLYFISHFL